MIKILKSIINFFITSTPESSKALSPQIKLNENQLVKFEFIKKNYNINQLTIGQKVSLWSKPDTSEVYVFVYGDGNFFGSGFIGKFISSNFNVKYPYPQYKAYASILNIENNNITLAKNLEIIDTVKSEKDYYKKLGEILLSPYKPKSCIKVAFVLSKSLQPWNNKIRINHCLNSQIINSFVVNQSFDLILDSIWLEDFSTKIISLSNKTDRKELIRLVRVLIFNIEINLNYIKKRSNQHYHNDRDIAYFEVTLVN